MELTQYIRSIELNKKSIQAYSKYPFCLPAVKNLNSLELHPNVTFLVGENGSGKSTILEAIAVSSGYNAEGGSRNFNFSTRESHSELYKHIKIIKGVHRPTDGYFLRAESFYNVATNIEQIDPDLVNAYGGRSLHEQSHGESFLALLLNRFRGNGLYILDEPEAALSPSRQMSIITRIHDLVKKGSQFIITTHSPILMAYPHATIYQIDNGYKKVEYQETEHYKDMHNFILNPKRMLNILLEE